MKSGALRRGFSLMEMMVVLLIVAIIAAASAPMVTKKMSRNAGSADSPWIFTGLSNSIAYNLNGGNDIAIIGASSYNNNGGPTHPRLVLAAGNDTNHPPLAFADNTGKFSFQFNINPSTGTVAINDTRTPGSSVALGFGQTIEDPGSITIGDGTKTKGIYTVAIGSEAEAEHSGVAIGHKAKALEVEVSKSGSMTVTNGGGIAIGHLTHAYANATAVGLSARAIKSDSIAVGHDANANNENSIAIGVQARANHKNSVAIGKSVETTAPDQIILGDESTTVYVPGYLVVGKDAFFGWDISVAAAKTPLIVKTPHSGMRRISYDNDDEDGPFHLNLKHVGPLPDPFSSDRRLKNVGKAYTAGLEDLKKLDFFHYTFKKDEAKTPRVGVMAQDLEKVFPDAVTKGDDGFLRIRWEDMFYAVINAVKELDAKISAVVQDITDVQDTIKTQQEQIDELEKQNAELEKRIEKLEKSLKKDKKTEERKKD